MKTHPTFHLWSLLLTIKQVQAWTYSANMNVTSPPPVRSGYQLHNDEYISTGISAFPCANVPVPNDVSRSPFPTINGRLSYSMANTTAGSAGYLNGSYHYNTNVYVGQIKLDNGSYTVPQQASNGMNLGYWGLGTEVYRGLQTEDGCGYEHDIPTSLGNALRRELSVEDVEGMEATIGTNIVLFGESNSVEIMYFCGYVKFTNESLIGNAAAGQCNSNPIRLSNPAATAAGSPDSTITSSLGLNTAATATGSPDQATTKSLGAATPSSTGIVVFGPTSSPTDPYVQGATPSGHQERSSVNTLAIALGVGITVGLGLIFLIVALIWLRRRKARKSKATIGVDVMITRDLGAGNSASGEGRKEKDMEKEMMQNRNSVQDEPLPVYRADQ